MSADQGVSGDEERLDLGRRLRRRGERRRGRTARHRPLRRARTSAGPASGSSPDLSPSTSPAASTTRVVASSSPARRASSAARVASSSFTSDPIAAARRTSGSRSWSQRTASVSPSTTCASTPTARSTGLGRPRELADRLFELRARLAAEVRADHVRARADPPRRRSRRQALDRPHRRRARRPRDRVCPIGAQDRVGHQRDQRRDAVVRRVAPQRRDRRRSNGEIGRDRRARRERLHDARSVRDHRQVDPPPGGRVVRQEPLHCARRSRRTERHERSCRRGAHARVVVLERAGRDLDDARVAERPERLDRRRACRHVHSLRRVEQRAARPQIPRLRDELGDRRRHRLRPRRRSARRIGGQRGQRGIRPRGRPRARSRPASLPRAPHPRPPARAPRSAARARSGAHTTARRSRLAAATASEPGARQ